eukprot:3044954-Amphidinium_carterae.1
MLDNIAGRRLGVAAKQGYLSQADVNEIFGAYGSLSTCKVQQVRMIVGCVCKWLVCKGGPGKASALIQWISVEEASRIRELLGA